MSGLICFPNVHSKDTDENTVLSTPNTVFPFAKIKLHSPEKQIMTFGQENLITGVLRSSTQKPLQGGRRWSTHSALGKTEAHGKNETGR